MIYQKISFDQYRSKAATIWISLDQVSSIAKDLVYGFTHHPDVLTPLENGKEWILRELCKFQPETGQVLLDGSELFVGSSRPIKPSKREGSPPEGVLSLFLETHGCIVQIGRTPANRVTKPSMSDNLPNEIRKAYYDKELLDGLVLLNRAVSPSNGRLFPIPTSFGWPTIDHCSGWLKAKTKVLNKIVSSLELEEDRNGNHFGLRVFMIHLPNEEFDYRDSDIFLLHEKRNQIVVIKNGDLSDTRILENYSEAFDKYCAHILKGNTTSFSFDQFLGDSII